jgi:3-methylfumaryl-CoA hydratase
MDVERHTPSMGHWAFFLAVAPDSQIGEDGHPRRGDFLPPITLPRRMFAGAAVRFGAKLQLGKPATRTSTIVSLNHKAGRSGDLVFVEVDQMISQDGAMCVSERQTIVYRGEGEKAAAVVPKPQTPAPGDVLWTPGPVNLFRFSAVTFNNHRIHYDAPYVTEVEGYPGLVVHGPFTAAKLLGHARKRAGRALSSFTFRALAPLFVSQEVRLAGGETPDAVVAIRCDGATSMAANFAA